MYTAVQGLRQVARLGPASCLSSAVAACCAIKGGSLRAKTIGPKHGSAVQACFYHDEKITQSHRQTHEEVAEYMSKLFNLEGSVAFVTGAAGSIGKATCLALARCGADIFATDVDVARMGNVDKLCQEVADLGRTAYASVCDVRDKGSVDAAVRECDKKFGRLEILVANAGILGEVQEPQDMTEENWRNVFAVNVDGALHCARAAHPLLKQSGRGKVVIMSSVAGITGYGTQAAYCASKGALIPLAKSLALAWAKDGINVNLVMPGAVNTAFTRRILDNPTRLAYMLDRIPLGRLAEAEDIVGPIVFYSSRASDYCTGSQLIVDGGGTSRAMAA